MMAKITSIRSFALLIFLVLPTLSVPLPVCAEKLILYMDTVTKQLYAEPGENRIKLGVFQQVEETVSKSPAEEKSRPDESPTRHAETRSAQDSEQRVETQSKQTNEQIKHASRTPVPSAEKPKEEKKWYERISIKGYTQFRYGKSLWGDNDGASYWQDKSAGPDKSSFLIKRARLALSGDITDYLYFYLQADLASSAILRDAYGDLFFDKGKEYRVRVGQSKIPLGFESLQSSSERLALDRTDAMDCCNERDIGAFFMWTPTHVQERFKAAKKLKGTGDYGMFSFGTFGGQGPNNVDLNNGVHIVGRLTYPFQFGNGQLIEVGASAYHGRYVPKYDKTKITGVPEKGIRDERVGVHAILYPQPFGLQAEWNWGNGPSLSDDKKTIANHSLNGGYVQAMYKYDGFRWGTLLPFVKWQRYNGALRLQDNTPQDRVRDWEFGVEWQISPAVELTTVYHMMNRTDLKHDKQFKSDVVRFQVQWNYF
ncbi:Phosphate-selective porin [Nitrosomonas eutropha]|nr:porin [Nitrosomonas sp. GH22]SCX04976.1 Phosphate-selective porin [Nitrosomonas eutropha]SDW47024.1 Phosphate-selective porin [Nitrosomonas eutropha]